MRISDWSSDVCSSDLVPHRTVLAVDANIERIVVDHQPVAEHHLDAGADAFVHPGYPVVSLADDDRIAHGAVRSAERRVGKECVSTCRSRWSPYTKKTKTTINYHN